jgi:hypothetical protein
MAKTSTKEQFAVLSASEVLSSLPHLPGRAGMPALDSITGIQLLTPAVALGTEAAAQPTTVYRIIKTNEIDGYEPAAGAQEMAVSGFAAPTGDNFKGTARKAAKLSLATATMQQYQDLKNLIKSLAPDADMINHVPKIKTTATSDRVQEEKRNVKVKTFLYAASRENDNDFHLILGRDPTKTPEMYMTMELSGLPPTTSASFAKLKAARDAYKAFFGADLPGLTYDFYDPPIPVRVEGSLFFDIGHATGQRPGPKSLKSRMPTIWEVHPISKIVFL